MNIKVREPKRNPSIPKPKRLQIRDYGIEPSNQGMLGWDNVREWMLKPRNYWIATTRPNGNPHSVPIWGIWLEDVFYFGGGRTQKVVNMEHNPNVVVHTESGFDMVIIEGVVFEIPEEFQEIIDDEYESKYNLRHGPTVWWVDMRKVMAWDGNNFKDTPTKWLFTVDS